MLTQRFEGAIHEAIDQGIVAGAAVVAVNRSGGRIYENAFGTTVVGPKGTPMRLDSLLFLASSSKLITSVAALQCVEKGILSLDEPVTKFLPELKDPKIILGFDTNDAPIMKTATTQINLRHLLTHTSGLGYSNLHPHIEKFRQQQGLDNTLRRGTVVDDYTLPLIFEPGQGWEYATGLDWVGKLIERATGYDKLGHYMTDHIFEPLQMTSTSFRPPKSRLPRFSTRSVEGLVPADESNGGWPREQPTDDFGGAGLYSTAEDYGKFLGALLSNDKRLLQAHSIDELFKPQLKDTSHLTKAMCGPISHMLAPSMPAQIDWNHGLGGTIALNGVKGRGEPGFMHWSGMPNTFWWLDRARGLGGFYGSQLTPPGDRETHKLYAQLQRDVYELSSMTG